MRRDLATFREHARQMAVADHVPECPGTPERVAAHAKGVRGYRRLFGEDHPKATPVEPCPGCVSDSDRELWKRLADEVDTYEKADLPLR